MKLLFVHETKIKEDENQNYYTSGSYNKEVWDRYLAFSKKLTIIARKDSKIYSTDYAQKNFNYLERDKINLIEIPDLKSSITSFLSTSIRKRKNDTIKEKVAESDSVIVRLPSEAGYLAVKYSKKYNKPFFIEVVGCPWDSLWNYNIKGKILAPISYLKLKKTVRNAPYVLYVTSHFLQNRYPNYGKNIGCSDVKLIKQDENVLHSRLLKIRSKKVNDPLILGTTAAVDVRYKGQEYVIRALGKLKKEGYQFRYILAGGGDITYLKKIASDNDVLHEVEFLGSIPHNQVFDYLDNLDIYIQPSKQEGLPRALVEAMSRGCPSIGAKTGGIPELLNSDFIFKNGAVNEICELLKKFNKDTLTKEAYRSFDKAKEYNKDLLDEKRNSFYTSYFYDVLDTEHGFFQQRKVCNDYEKKNCD